MTQSVLHLGIHQEKNIYTKTSTQMFIIVLFVTTPNRKSLTSSSNSKWINKLWFFHIMEYYQAIILPKKGNAKECSNYCTIALISHASKVMLKILQARLQ